MHLYIQIPSLEYTYQFRVVVTTLFTSSYFMQLRGNPKFDVNHFGYLFIDESACVQEAVTIIPIVACSSKHKIVSKVVLAGDPHQLAATGNGYELLTLHSYTKT